MAILENISAQVARRSSKFRQNSRYFAGLMVDTTRSALGLEQRGKRQVHRRSNRSISGRYTNDLLNIAETNHLVGTHIDLSRILVEPRFLAEPDIIEPVAEDDVRQEVFYVVPRMPDLQHIIAPYNLPSYRISQLMVGHRRVAILGTPGSGRTTALMAILLWFFKEVTFEEPDDPVKEILAAEEAELSDKEREEKERRREEMQREAKEQLEMAIESGEIEADVPLDEDDDELEEGATRQPPISSLLPIFVDCADLNINPRELGREIDPAEPLILAVQAHLSNLTARTVPRMIYDRLEQGRTLILIDGYDALPTSQQTRVEAWLKAFVQQYGDNFIIMTGPALGYKKLTNFDFTPVFMKPWSPRETETYVDKWVEAWPVFHQGEGEAVSNTQVKRAKHNNYALYPPEMTVKLWATFSDDVSKYSINAWMQDYIRDHLPGATEPEQDEMMKILQLAAVQQLSVGLISTKRLGEQLEKRTSDDDDQTTEDDTPEEDETQYTTILNQLEKANFILRRLDGNYRFQFSTLADYLGGQVIQKIAAETPQKFYDLAQKPGWKGAFRFAAAHTDLADIAQLKLQSDHDLLHSNLIEVSQWLRMDKTEGGWRDDVLRRLSDIFLNEQEFISLRERAAAALVETRISDISLQVFEQALDSPSVDNRRIACLGLGALGHHAESFAERLSGMTMEHEESIQLAAAHALAGLQTEEALLGLAEAFLTGEERLQQAAAEEFAAMPQEGYLTLYEATEHEELKIRRAAMFGMRRIETDWAREVIRQSFLSEREWYVRVVSQDAFIQDQAGLVGPGRSPSADQIEWVQDWSQDREIPLPRGRKSLATLLKTLQDPAIEVRALGAMALGQMGVRQAIDALYKQLQDENPIVREAAHKGLFELQLRLGIPLGDPA